ncbi:MAG: hypothetical protein HY390_05140 [Deltaproteobacteria bacterium]|nr:hypothetical protein [Deltaproteobacteria bacterium]
MKAIMMVCDQELQPEMDFLLRSNHIETFTLIQKVQGSGESGLKLGNPIGPGLNLVYWIVLDPVTAKKFVEELKLFKEQKLKKKGVQVFVIPIEEGF